MKTEAALFGAAFAVRYKNDCCFNPCRFCRDRQEDHSCSFARIRVDDPSDRSRIHRINRYRNTLNLHGSTHHHRHRSRDKKHRPDRRPPPSFGVTGSAAPTTPSSTCLAADPRPSLANAQDDIDNLEDAERNNGEEELAVNTTTNTVYDVSHLFLPHLPRQGVFQGNQSRQQSRTQQQQ
jgi:hypothetical protein